MDRPPVAGAGPRHLSPDGPDHGEPGTPAGDIPKAAALGITPLARVVSTGCPGCPRRSWAWGRCRPLDTLNVNGGAIAIGHPFGMTGARITTTLLNSLSWHDKTIGLETMCVGAVRAWRRCSSGSPDGCSGRAHQPQRGRVRHGPGLG